MAPLRLFLADDHEVVRAGLKTLIQTQPDMEVVGEAADGRDALARAPLTKPDVAVVDLTLPDLTGAQLVRELKMICPAVKCVGLTVHEDKSFIAELLAAGATGYVLKRAAGVELINAIRAVASGGTFIDPRVAARFVAPLVATLEKPTAELSRREVEVLRQVALGYSHKEISAQLRVSLKTVETYKARAMEKLGLRGRVEIIRHASEAGWLRVCA